MTTPEPYSIVNLRDGSVWLLPTARALVHAVAPYRTVRPAVAGGEES